MSVSPRSSNGGPPDSFWVGSAYHVEPSLNRVTGPNGVKRLEPKVMQVLVCLTERAGQMVPKDRLLEAAWADTAVTDDVLTRAISALRRLFEDDSRSPRIIETIPKAGYRLIAPVAHRSGPAAVTTLLLAPLKESEEQRGTPSTLPRRSRRRVAAVSGGGALVLELASVWRVLSPHDRLQGPRPAVSFSVPPGTRMWFAARSDQLDVEWNGETVANVTISITIVGSSEARPLPANDRDDGVHVERPAVGRR